MQTGFTRLTEPQSGSDQTRSGLAFAQEGEKALAKSEFLEEILAANLGFGVRTPDFQFIGLLEFSRLEGRRGVETSMAHGKADDEGAAGAYRQGQGGQGEVLVTLHCPAKRRQRGGRLFERGDAFGDGERRIERKGCPVEERLPGRMLPLHQGRRMGGAIAEEVGAGVVR